VQEAAASTGSNKRAAASSSQKGTQSKRRSVQSTSERVMNESHNATNNKQAEGTNTEVQNSSARNLAQPFHLAQEIKITGCGMQEANGTYLGMSSTNGAIRFFRRGEWKGQTRYRILRIL
jgi:hypothetical protein